MSAKSSVARLVSSGGGGTGAPQLPQKFAPGLFGNAQYVQRAGSAVLQRPQNRRSSAFDAPQLWQCIRQRSDITLLCAALKGLHQTIEGGLVLGEIPRIRNFLFL